MTTPTVDHSPAYICGQVYFILAKTLRRRSKATDCLNPQVYIPLLFQRLCAITHKGPKDEITSLMANLGQIPGPLTLEEQSDFWLGYYHRRAS